MAVSNTEEHTHPLEPVLQELELANWDELSQLDHVDQITLGGALMAKRHHRRYAKLLFKESFVMTLDCDENHDTVCNKLKKGINDYPTLVSKEILLSLTKSDDVIEALTNRSNWIKESFFETINLSCNISLCPDGSVCTNYDTSKVCPRITMLMLWSNVDRHLLTINISFGTINLGIAEYISSDSLNSSSELRKEILKALNECN